VIHWLHDLPEHVLSMNPVWMLVVCGLLVFVEDAIFVGFVVPGETAAVVAGVATTIANVPLAAAIVVVVAAAIIGDTVGYTLGKYLFARVRHRGILARHDAQISRAEDFLQRRGGIAVFLGRFTAFFRAMMPALAGAGRMHYPVFLRWNAIGGVIWGTAFVLLGHVAGRSYQTVAKQASTGLAIALAVIIVGAIVVWRVRKERSEKAENAESAGSTD
jgi:membrane protein DedA with SNARE-associated domain